MRTYKSNLDELTLKRNPTDFKRVQIGSSKTTIREFLSEQHGNTEYHDLFEFYDEQPSELKKIVDFYSDKIESSDYTKDTYKFITKFHDAVNKIGYTFDSGLDAQPFGLRPIGVELNQLKGWENI